MRKLTRLILVIAIAACGDAAGAETTTTTETPTTTTTSTSITTTSTTTTVPTTTTTVDPIAEAATYYLEVVLPVNCNGAELATAEDEFFADGFLYDEEWPAFADSVLPLYGERAEILVTFVESLTAYEWPEEVREDVQRQVEELASIASWARDLSRVDSFEAYAQFPPYPGDGGPAAVVRAKLGLPSNILLEWEDVC